MGVLDGPGVKVGVAVEEAVLMVTGAARPVPLTPALDALALRVA